MRYTVSIKKNRDFKRLYSSGKSFANQYLALYVRRNRTVENRLGITVGTRLGKAVVRNKVRRRIREAYRLMEDRLSRGYDIVVVARTRAAAAPYRDIEGALRFLFKKSGILDEKP